MWVNQAISRPFGINVFGSSLVRADPDLVFIKLTVRRVADKPQESFRAAHDATAAVRAVLRSRGVPDASLQTSRVSLEMSFGAYPEHRFLGYEAAVELRILLEDLEALEPLLNEVVDAGAHQIDAVQYQTRFLRELRLKARTQAVESARRKAAAYAEAALVQLGPVLHIEDVDPESLVNRGHMPDIDATEHDETATIGALDSGSLTVTAAVMVSFGILPGQS